MEREYVKVQPSNEVDDDLLGDDVSVVWVAPSLRADAEALVLHYPRVFSLNAAWQGEEVDSRDECSEHVLAHASMGVLFTNRLGYARYAVFGTEPLDGYDPVCAIMRVASLEDFFLTVFRRSAGPRYVNSSKSHVVPDSSASSWTGGGQTCLAKQLSDPKLLEPQHYCRQVRVDGRPGRKGWISATLLSSSAMHDRRPAPTWAEGVFYHRINLLRAAAAVSGYEVDEDRKYVRLKVKPPREPGQRKRRWKRNPTSRLHIGGLTLELQGDVVLGPRAPSQRWETYAANVSQYFGPGDFVPMWMSQLTSHAPGIVYRLQLALQIMQDGGSWYMDPMRPEEWIQAFIYLNSYLGGVRSRVGLKFTPEALPPEKLGPLLRSKQEYPTAGHMAWAMTHLGDEAFVVQWAFMLMNLRGVCPVLPTRSPIYDFEGVGGLLKVDADRTLFWVPGMNHSAAEYLEAVYGDYVLFGVPVRPERRQLIDVYSDALWVVISECTVLVPATLPPDGGSLSYPYTW